MEKQLYEVKQTTIQNLLSWDDSEEIAIPEIQRPFVWNSAQVRDFIDSLYSGYPVGYLITWITPNIRLKDGEKSIGKKILIDGQQRVIALLAALSGKHIINKNYTQKRIIISFHPGDKIFEVRNAAIQKNQEWIQDISEVFKPETSMRKLVDNYCLVNPEMKTEIIDDRILRLKNILFNNIGLIELKSELKIDTVTEIFVRINSKGVSLNTSDFVMSKMAANDRYDGHLLRKCIDYFCNLAVSPESYNVLSQDESFNNTEYFNTMKWLRHEREDLYDPSYTDMLRVTFTTEFQRGRLSDLVALLSGRNFETRSFEDSIAEDSFERLNNSVFHFMNETNFKRFIMILRSAGFITSSMIKSKNTANFAYILYLTLRKQKVDDAKIESFVRRWFVMSVLTARYTGSSETVFDSDIRLINESGVVSVLRDIENSDLSDTFWNVGFPLRLKTSVASSPYFNVFLASQVKRNDKGFLSKDLTVQVLLEGQSNIHHVFPKKYLQNHGYTQSSYNQIANYVVMQSEINIAIKAKPPKNYFSEVIEQCQNGRLRLGGIRDLEQLRENLKSHCIPDEMESITADNYEEFLNERRQLISYKIRDYYKTL